MILHCIPLNYGIKHMVLKIAKVLQAIVLNLMSQVYLLTGINWCYIEAAKSWILVVYISNIKSIYSASYISPHPFPRELGEVFCIRLL